MSVVRPRRAGRRRTVRLATVAAVALLAAGCAVDLGTLGGASSYGSDINEDGVIVGWSLVAGTDARHAFVKPPDGPMVDLNGDFLQSTALAVNDAGTVVGVATVATGDSRAVLWDADGEAHDLGAGPGSVAWDINSGGTVVGTRSDESFVVDGATGEVESLPMPPAPPPGTPSHAAARAINDAGTIAGEYFAYPHSQAMLWRAGTHEPVLLAQPTPPGPIGGRQVTYVEDINAAGTIVGWSGSSSIAVLWDADTLAPANITPPGYEYANATGINDRGQVVGTAGERAVRWVPGAGEAIDLGGLGGGSTLSSRINESGDATGSARSRLGGTPEAPTTERAVLYTTR